MRRLFLIFVCLSAAVMSVELSAKDLERFLLRGYIYDDKSMVDSVTVTVMKNDTIEVPIKLLVGDDKTKLATGGQVRAMVNSGLGDYKLMLYKDGYELLVKEFTIASVSEDIKYLSALIMKKEEVMSRDLDAVTVESTRVKMVLKGDTVVFDAAAFKLSEGSMLEELVRQLPNATLDSDGVIKVNGRKMNELLINGKDFFKGDPKVALKNLPSYTVKNIKVYDKKADDAYLTHSDAKLDTREEDQNMVMDVVLKKEYNTGWMANATAGYGTADRYQAQAFGMGYTDKFRLAAFANVNNVGNTGKADLEGNWNGGWRESGTLDLVIGGLDYSYDDSKKWRVSGNLQASHEDVKNHNISASTNFYPSGDTYSRSDTRQKEIKKHLMSNHSIRYNGSNFSITANPRVDWLIRDRWYNSRSAQLSENPYETYRGEVLDSLFSSRGSQSSYEQYLLTRLRHMSRSNPGWIQANGGAYMTLRPKTWKGYLLGYVSGDYNRHTTDDRTVFVQHYGPNQPVAGSKPVNREQWSPQSNESKSVYANVEYNREIRKFGDERTKTWGMNVTVSYGYSYTDNNTKLYLGSDSVIDSNMLPSLIEPAGVVLDMLNSYHSRSTTDKGGVSARFGFRSEVTAPSDSGFNATWGAGIALNDQLTWDRLEYVKPEQAPQVLSRTDNRLSPNVYFNFNSTNKQRNVYAYVNYNYSRSTPSLWMELNGRASSNPLNVYLGTEGLKLQSVHGVSFNLYRWSRGDQHANMSTYLNWNVVLNSNAQARTYDKYTGVNTYKPMNINGNWGLNFGGAYGISVGPGNKFELNGGMGFEFRNSVDYVTLETSPMRSSVRNITLDPRADVNWRISEGSTLGVSGSMAWRNALSDREGFETISSQDYTVGMRGDFVLPWDLRFKSSLNLKMRRNYSDNAMNTNEWLWNASIEKSIMKGSMTLKLEGVDILNSVKDISVYVNSQGRYETWQNSLPRYVMASVSYKFSMKPKNKR